MEVLNMASSTVFARLSAALGVTAVVFLLDWFYLIYITSYGLQQKTQDLVLGGLKFSVPLHWVPVAGIVIVSLVSWYEVSTRLFPKRPGMDVDPIARLRLLRAIVISVALFACVLYVPYLLGSNWFWARLAEMSRNITQVGHFGLELLHSIQSLMVMNTLWQYSLSQNLAAGAMVLASWGFGRAPRRTRRQR